MLLSISTLARRFHRNSTKAELANCSAQTTLEAEASVQRRISADLFTNTPYEAETSALRRLASPTLHGEDAFARSAQAGLAQAASRRVSREEQGWSRGELGSMACLLGGAAIVLPKLLGERALLAGDIMPVFVCLGLCLFLQQLHRGNEPAFLQLGRAELQLQQNAAAERAFAQAPSYLGALLGLIEARRRQGKFMEAEVALERLVHSDDYRQNAKLLQPEANRQRRLIARCIVAPQPLLATDLPRQSGLLRDDGDEDLAIDERVGWA